jgi:hypothetical protein
MTARIHLGVLPGDMLSSGHHWLWEEADGNIVETVKGGRNRNANANQCGRGYLAVKKK